MKFLPKLFENNGAWAEQRKIEDPQYFERLARHRRRSISGSVARIVGCRLTRSLVSGPASYLSTAEEARWRRLCELNVMAQVRAVRQTEVVKAAWRQDRPVVVHGWIYDLREGLLRDLDLN